MRALPILILACLMLGGLLLAAPAHAAVLGDPKAIARVMTEMGIPVTQGHDIEGQPMLEGKVDDTLFNVYFYDCATLCRRMQLVTGFSLNQPMSAEDANAWNRDNPFGKVVLNDSGDPYLEMDIGVADDGLGRKNLEDTLNTWRAVLGDFRALISE